MPSFSMDYRWMRPVSVAISTLTLFSCVWWKYLATHCHGSPWIKLVAAGHWPAHISYAPSPVRPVVSSRKVKSFRRMHILTATANFRFYSSHRLDMGGDFVVLAWKTWNYIGLCYVIRPYSWDVANSDPKYWSGDGFNCSSAGRTSCSICAFIGNMMQTVFRLFCTRSLINWNWHLLSSLTFINRCHYCYSDWFHWSPVCWHYFYPKHLDINCPTRWVNHNIFSTLKKKLTWSFIVSNSNEDFSGWRGRTHWLGYHKRHWDEHDGDINSKSRLKCILLFRTNNHHYHCYIRVNRFNCEQQMWYVL